MCDARDQAPGPIEGLLESACTIIEICLIAFGVALLFFI